MKTTFHIACIVSSLVGIVVLVGLALMISGQTAKGENRVSASTSLDKREESMTFGIDDGKPANTNLWPTRTMVDGVTKMKLKTVFEEIAVAYSNRQIQTMQIKLDMVASQTLTIPQESYREIIRPFVVAFNKEFLRNEGLSEFDSVSEFSDNIRFNMATALMLGDMHVSRKDFSVLLKWLEGLTLRRLKRYQKKFHNDRHMDMADCAERFIKEWIVRIESDDGFTRRYMRFYRDSQYDAISRTTELDEPTKAKVLKVVRQEIYEVSKVAEYTPSWVSEFLTPKWLDEEFSTPPEEKSASPKKDVQR